ncbi:cupin domain-containing protein [Pectobacteriaceae bacterium C52]|nr:cupin domain-containing protein [Pectobacteriaceae bacterium C52]
MIDRNEKGKYKEEYDVKIRRFTELFNCTFSVKHEMNAAISIVEPGESIRKHTHELEEFFLVIGGRAVLELNGENIEMDDGDVALAKYNESHEFKNVDEKTIRVFSFWWKKYGEVE